MKILNVVNIYFTVPYFLGDQISHFVEKGHEEFIICSPAYQLAEFAKQQQCQYYEVPISRNFTVLEDLKAVAKITKFIRKNKLDIVCGHTPKAGLLAMIAAKLGGVKKRIFFRHGLVYETASGIKRKILILSERIASFLATDVVCVSPYLKDKSIEDKLTRKDKLIVLNHGSSTGIDSEEIFNPALIDRDKKTKLRQQLGLKDDDFVAGYVGRMVKDKGIVELVTAYRNLKEKEPNIHLLLVGPLEERDAVPQEIIDYIQRDPQIHHVGLIEEDLEYYYSCMDVLVLPTHREGLGMALLEAQSMEKPVMAPSHTGSKDAFVANRTGLYIDLNPLSIENGLELYMKFPNVKKEHGKEGREFVTKNFNRKLIWDEIEKLYFKQ